MINDEPGPPVTHAGSAGNQNHDVARRPQLPRTAQGAFEWPANFFRRVDIALEQENTPWIRSKREFKSPEDEITFFLQIDDVSARVPDREDGIDEGDAFIDAERRLM
ncbi:hypothetical protein C8034_v001331 [Colletotrichum sidae]|uniref:Uncharacterized protein n=1 Tax=Colletotrichum sidae TaxID=1347389 RepID=A0A4R8TET8_9PEZI|nr:hypothetical protein C8034_v001331 [Colletotrichum sidae]